MKVIPAEREICERARARRDGTRDVKRPRLTADRCTAATNPRHASTCCGTSVRICGHPRAAGAGKLTAQREKKDIDALFRCKEDALSASVCFCDFAANSARISLKPKREKRGTDTDRKSQVFTRRGSIDLEIVGPNRVACLSFLISSNRYFFFLSFFFFNRNALLRNTRLTPRNLLLLRCSARF